jgi:hypothetical protein
MAVAAIQEYPKLVPALKTAPHGYLWPSYDADTDVLWASSPLSISASATSLRLNATPTQPVRSTNPSASRKLGGTTLSSSRSPKPVAAAPPPSGRRSAIPCSPSSNAAPEVAVARHAPDRVTEAMNRTLAEINERADDFSRAASRRVLERSDW